MNQSTYAHTHTRFRYRTAQQLRDDTERLGVSLPWSDDLAALARPVPIGAAHAPNALAINPMEGCDGTPDGRPGELTERRYLRFARGGSGLLWFEATAVVPEGRANPRQLYLCRDTQPAFARLRTLAEAAAQDAMGADHHPYTVLQLTHSGRYSRPTSQRAPVIAHHDGVLDKAMGIAEDHPLITDDALDRLQDSYVSAARLAAASGFDAVDIKCCHRYLLSELLAAHTRPGRYGGSFENRTRLLLDVVHRVRAEVPEVQVVVRLNVYDGHPYPWGWGTNVDDPTQPDLTEPRRLVRLLHDAGVVLVNVTAGNPYYTPHINRPFDTNVTGGYTPDEHPLVGVSRIIGLAAEIKAACPQLAILGSGYSWLRQYIGSVGSGVVAAGGADLIGVGREAFAYPDFARDLLTQGGMDPPKCCVACSRCTQIMRDGGEAGCVPFDREVYGPIYKRGRAPLAKDA